MSVVISLFCFFLFLFFLFLFFCHWTSGGEEREWGGVGGGGGGVGGDDRLNQIMCNDGHECCRRVICISLEDMFS